MKDMVRKLELRLGPGTSELDLRIGLHSGTEKVSIRLANWGSVRVILIHLFLVSGQVTAGVLRGERSRFQVRPAPARISGIFSGRAGQYSCTSVLTVF